MKRRNPPPRAEFERDFRTFSFLCLAILVSVPLLARADLQQDERSYQISSHQLKNILSCSGEAQANLRFVLERETFTAPFKELLSTAIIPPTTVCNIFLQTWLSELRTEPEHQFKFHLSPLARNKHTFDFPQLLNRCRELGYCVKTVIDWVGARETLLSCQPKHTVSSLFSLVRPKLLKANYQKIPKVEVLLFPFESFHQHVNHQSDQSGYTYISTMTLGSRSALRFAERMKENNRHSFLMLDAALLLADLRLEKLTDAFAQHQNISVFPMTKGYDFESIHHWKMILGESNNDPSILSSMNFSTPERTPLLDFSYRFLNNSVTKELRYHFDRAIRLQCDRRSDFNCAVDFAARDETLRSKLSAILSTSCQRYLSTVPRPPKPDSKFFMQPQDTDLEALVVDLIDSANESVVLFSHKFTLEKVLAALKRAEQRGVEVLLFTSTTPPFGTIPAFIFHPQREGFFKGFPAPHMKALVVDRKELFFGTGNFSYNAFQSAREFFAITDDQEAIDQVLSLVPSLLGAYRQPYNFVVQATLESQWIVLSENTLNSIGIPHWLRSKTEHQRSYWMKKYRKVKAELRKILVPCKLNQHLFITEETFRNCVNASDLHHTK